ncbi:MAG: hypothetical protein MJZ68_02635 [archaeon]|nr:hypothetical protein [archaeon]
MIDGIFEVIMLLCFAASWPVNILKTYRMRTTKGKTVMFDFIVVVGYIAGIANKVVNDNMDYVLYFYILDIALVSVDIALWFRNLRLDRRAGIV